MFRIGDYAKPRTPRCFEFVYTAQSYMMALILYIWHGDQRSTGINPDIAHITSLSTAASSLKGFIVCASLVVARQTRYPRQCQQSSFGLGSEMGFHRRLRPLNTLLALLERDEEQLLEGPLGQ
jgi:hypothetical protein